MTSGTMSARVGANIRRYRDERGVSARRFAEMLGEVGLPMSQSMVTRIENGQRTVTVEHLAAFAEVLDVAPVDLLEEPTSTTSPEAIRLRLDRRDMPPVAGTISPEVMRVLAGVALISPETRANLARIGSVGIAGLGEELTRRIEPLLRAVARAHPRVDVDAEIERDTRIADGDDSGIVAD